MKNGTSPIEIDADVKRALVALLSDMHIDDPEQALQLMTTARATAAMSKY